MFKVRLGCRKLCRICTWAQSSGVVLAACSRSMRCLRDSAWISVPRRSLTAKIMPARIQKPK